MCECVQLAKKKQVLSSHQMCYKQQIVFKTCIGGFGSYMFAMSETTGKQSTEANNPQNTKNLSLGWIIGFLFTVSFLGLFSVLPLRKVGNELLDIYCFNLCS